MLSDQVRIKVSVRVHISLNVSDYWIWEMARVWVGKSSSIISFRISIKVSVRIIVNIKVSVMLVFILILI